MKHSKQEIPFNGYFEDSELEYVSGSEEEEQSDEEIKKRKKQPKQKKIYYPPNKIIMNVSGSYLHNHKQDTQYPVVKFVGKLLLKWKLQYETEVWSWDLMWTDNAVQPETLARM
jgi:tubulin polyglutamylase TTLL6/13